MHIDCFACLPDAPHGSEARWLCPDHKYACVLTDGALLRTTLELASPPDAPLEGSSLGWLYNPVFVVDSSGHRQRGWTDFAAGGMAVLEDRFKVKDAFEFWMCEREEMVELLMDLPAFASASPDSRARLKRSLRPALVTAYDMWVWKRAIDARRTALGRWPTSFVELTAILRLTASARNLIPEDEAEFLAILAPIAAQRMS